jgi:hypothetical protein
MFAQGNYWEPQLARAPLASRAGGESLAMA